MIKPKQLIDRIKANEEIAEDIFRMTVESFYIAENAVPGQFVDIKCGEGTDAILRRPISICSVNRENGTYELLFQKKGKGTGLLSIKKAGDALDVIGPLGNGFKLDAGYARIAVVGGGIGIFPLLFTLRESRAAEKKAYLGFRTKNVLMLKEEFANYATDLKISTDDGSFGERGFVTDLLKRDMLFEKFDMIYACGPGPMLKKVAELSRDNGCGCQLSLEQRMGCGFGACLVCACKTRSEDGKWQYKHVCKDGPIFDGRDIVFD